MLCFLATGDVAILTGETNVKSHALKLTSGYSSVVTPSAGLKLSLDRPIYSSAAFFATISSVRESLMQAGLKR